MRSRRAVLWAVGLCLPALHAWACSLAEGGFGPMMGADATVDASFSVPKDTGSEEVAPDTTTDAGVEDAADAGMDADADEQCRRACDGGVCVAGACTIECSPSSPCGHDRCPAGVPCKLHCKGQFACDAVECTNCEVRCDGPQACKNKISCEGSGCAILCCGAQSCLGNVECEGAGCGVVCDPSNSACANTPKCENGLPTCDAGHEC
ncbi:hypothetical protein LZC95_05325 [Pendulispora brunnea]|uniref:Uncharacterized protein n=1 Tax=Pendulispora brunnea TaxID=2905690 RepID=A0ABZ2KC41_9BACT